VPGAPDLFTSAVVHGTRSFLERGVDGTGRIAAIIEAGGIYWDHFLIGPDKIVACIERGFAGCNRVDAWHGTASPRSWPATDSWPSRRVASSICQSSSTPDSRCRPTPTISAWGS
jgi:hypothetical protein